MIRYKDHLEELVRARTTALEQEIHERKQIEQALQAARDAAEAANRAKSVFLANMSHELRTPLNAILGFAQLMVRETQLSVRQQEYLGIINRSGAHLLALINEVLDMSKIEAGHAVLESRSFDLQVMLKSIAEMMQGRAQAKRLRFVVTPTPDVPQYITTDERKLRQVLINLLGNAVKFTTAGEIALRVARCQGEALQDGQTRRAVILRFEIEDTGAGIAPDELDHIFEPFAQAPSASQISEGTGLGLAISRQFVRLMGGEITVTSELGRGSLFRFTIQVAAADMAAAIPQPRRRVVGLAAGQPAYRILIVEDHEFNRALLRTLLQHVGFAVRTAQNGQEAVDFAVSWQPHLIWMDMRLPIMDGYEATRRIRHEELSMRNLASDTSACSHIPIIALTASVFEDNRAQVLAAGCDDFLRKPFEEHEIFAMLAKYLDVQYIYDVEAVAAAALPETVPAALPPDVLTALPPALRDDLVEAIVQLDRKRIAAVIAAIHSQDARIAEALTALAQRFKYQDILHWLAHPDVTM